MYNEKIEKLIELALADGELTEKEKQILFKKAENEGIDLDEFEMVLDAKLFEKNRKNTVSTPVSAPKSDKFGDVKKCPSCGTIVESFSTSCSDCGYEFRNIEASKSLVKFFEKLDEIESSNSQNLTQSQVESSKITIGKILLWMFFYWILIPIKVFTFFLNKSKPANWNSFDSRKEDLIMNFPIPTTKEDLMEFATLSTSRIKSIDILKRYNENGKYIAIWNTIWINKSQQIYTKAQLSMINDRSTLKNIENLINSAVNANKKEERFAKNVLLILLGLVFLSVIILISI